MGLQAFKVEEVAHMSAAPTAPNIVASNPNAIPILGLSAQYEIAMPKMAQTHSHQNIAT